MYKPLLLATTLLSATSAAQAQVHFTAGPQAGYTLTTVNFKLDSGRPYTTSSRSGFAAGVMADIGFGHLAIQPAVQFAQKGYDQTVTSSLVTSSQVRFNYLAVPINLAYTQHRDGQGVQVFVGPYVGVLLGGHYTSVTRYPPSILLPDITKSGKVVAAESYAPSATDSSFYSRRLDAGLQFGLGYRYQGLLLQAAYSLGLTNQASVAEQLPGGGPSVYPTYRNRAFQVSLAYLLGSAH
jgi:hypothetical protein